MRSLLFRSLAALVAAVLAAGGMVLVVLGRPWEAAPMFAMGALFSGYAVFGERCSSRMLSTVFGIPADALNGPSERAN